MAIAFATTVEVTSPKRWNTPKIINKENNDTAVEITEVREYRMSFRPWWDFDHARTSETRAIVNQC